MRACAYLAATVLLVPTVIGAQEHVHAPGMSQHAVQQAIASPGQAAFGAIAEIVRTLEADPATDWSTVDIEAVRQHLIDMDEVTLRAAIAQMPVPGGARFEVEGAGRTREAIRRMTRAHAATMREGQDPRMIVTETDRGATVTVIAADPRDASAVAKIRALGLIGLLTVGDHHGPHHLAMARGAHPHSGKAQ